MTTLDPGPCPLCGRSILWHYVRARVAYCSPPAPERRRRSTFKRQRAPFTVEQVEAVRRLVGWPTIERTPTA